MIRLNKYLATCGIGSRRHCDALIAEGRVTLNGEAVREMGVRVGAGDVVAVDGTPALPEEEQRYILYHKPAGEVTTASDDRGRRTVLDRFEGFPVRLYPVGRLDYDTEGLLLLTNDGALAHRLTHPSREVDKTYQARIAGEVSQEALRALRAGVRMEGEARPTAPAEVRVTAREADATVLLVTIHEGRNRQVRRMFEAVGYQMLYLRRMRFGPLGLGDLRRGEYRELTAGEVKALKGV
jgi:23S rRNA pseudouridine2605 synthase